MSSKKIISIIVFFAVCLSVGVSCFAVQEIKETTTINFMMRENAKNISQIFRTSHNMIEEAKPFLNPRYQARYRFAPGDKSARTILSLSRAMTSRFRMLRGIVCYAPMSGREDIFKNLISSLDSMVVFSKRSLRAVKDGNFALYMASAQGIEKEVLNIDQFFKDLEEQINQSIYKTDLMKEDL